MDGYDLTETVLRSVLKHVQFSIFEYITSTEMDKRRKLRDKVESVLLVIDKRNFSIHERQTIRKQRTNAKYAMKVATLYSEERINRNNIEELATQEFLAIQTKCVESTLARIGIQVDGTQGNMCDLKEQSDKQEAHPLLNEENPKEVDDVIASSSSTSDCIAVLDFPSTDVLHAFSIGCSYFENEEVIRLCLEGIEKMIQYSCIRCVCLGEAENKCSHCTSLFAGYYHDSGKAFVSRGSQSKSSTRSSMKFLTKCSCSQCSLVDNLFNHAIFPILLLATEKDSNKSKQSLGSLSGGTGSDVLQVQIVRVILTAASCNILHSMLLCEAITLLIELSVGKHSDTEETLPAQDKTNATLKDAQLVHQRRKLLVVGEIIKIRMETLHLQEIEADKNRLSDTLQQAIAPLFQVDDEGERVPVSSLFFLQSLAFSSLGQVVQHVIEGAQSPLANGMGICYPPKKQSDMVAFVHLHDFFCMINFFIAKSAYDFMPSNHQVEKFEPKHLFEESETSRHSIQTHLNHGNVLKLLHDLVSIRFSFKQTTEYVIHIEYLSYIFQRIQQCQSLSVIFTALYPAFCHFFNWTPLFVFLSNAFLVESSLAYIPALTCIFPSFVGIITNQIRYTTFLCLEKKVGLGVPQDSASFWHMVFTNITTRNDRRFLEFKKFTESFLTLYLFPALLHQDTSIKKRLAILESLRSIFTGVEKVTVSRDSLEEYAEVTDCNLTHAGHFGVSRLLNMSIYFDCDLTAAEVAQQFIKVLCRFASILSAEMMEQETTSQDQESSSEVTTATQNSRQVEQDTRQALIVFVLQILTEVFQDTGSSLQSFKESSLFAQGSITEENCMACHPVYTDFVNSIATESQIKEHLHGFVQIFNQGKVTPVLNYMKKSFNSLFWRQQHVRMAEEFPSFIAQHLLNVNGLVPDLLGEFLSQPESQLVTDILHTICNALPTAGELGHEGIVDTTGPLAEASSQSLAASLLLDIEQSFRAFLRSFPLPKEGQKIERLIEPFCVSWHKKASRLYTGVVKSVKFGDYFPNSDAIYLLAFAMLMLNTELHNRVLNHTQRKSAESQTKAQSQDSQSFIQFYGQIQGVDGLKDFTQEELFQLYCRIERKEFQSWKEVIIGKSGDKTENAPDSACRIPSYLVGLQHDRRLLRSEILESCNRNLEVIQKGVQDDNQPDDSCNSKDACVNEKMPLYSGTVLGAYISELLSMKNLLNSGPTPRGVSLISSDNPHQSFSLHRDSFPVLFSNIELHKWIVDFQQVYAEDCNKTNSQTQPKLLPYWKMYQNFVTASFLESDVVSRLLPRLDLSSVDSQEQTSSTIEGSAEFDHSTKVESKDGESQDFITLLSQVTVKSFSLASEMVNSIVRLKAHIQSPYSFSTELGYYSEKVLKVMAETMCFLDEKN
ncbi:hypothetical protein XU18_0898 [Perkinsela sp. CCAP 1560/4]|nr:hypothetical protein XU18_0898 [Perkinsela sp. CCAP 1560/4]|eukprot:KNH08612.1 hypothetical protein XU18_0898 [Perkinsela sp. CCAP 1560/4]